MTSPQRVICRQDGRRETAVTGINGVSQRGSSALAINATDAKFGKGKDSAHSRPDALPAD